MLPSLSFECEWIDQPAAADVLERRTWGCLRIQALGRKVTHVWDRYSHAERVTIFVPAFPLARWIVRNWWALLYEPCRNEDVPPAEQAHMPRQRAWLRRHCMRTAESGLLLPRVCFFSNGRGICVHWSADEPGAFPHMPAEFIEGGLVYLPFSEAEAGLRSFVGEVMSRLETESDSRAVRLRENWAAIIRVDSEEFAFCRDAGRMGLDPYQLSTWDPVLVALLENGFDEDRPMVADFLEAIDAQSAATVWKWVKETMSRYQLNEQPKAVGIPFPEVQRPSTAGYQLAESVRHLMRGNSDGPLASVADATLSLGSKPLTFEDHNQLSSRHVKATVGWRTGPEPVVVGPTPPREDNRRFLEARALYHAAFACHTGPRLITDAYTWEQQASRAFAAELLAPRGELAQRVEETHNLSSIMEVLAGEYRVSTKVIAHQLKNAGVDLGEE